MKKIIPKRLSVGDAIGVISPSGPVRDLERYQSGISFLKEKGFVVVEAPHVLDRWYHMAAKATDRADDINNMFANPKIRAIMPTVGGHTSSQVLDYLNWDLIEQNPKIFFGFSDSTALINAIYARTGLINFHSLSDVVYGFGEYGRGKFQSDGSYTFRSIERTVCHPSAVGLVPQLTTWEGLKFGTARGPLIGGNLSSLRSLIGTIYEPTWDGAILFLEDSAEPHRWDQQLGHLHLAGIFNRLAGLIIGKVEKPDKFYPESFQTVREIVLRHLVSLDYPIIFSADIGHNVENCTLPIGITAEVNGKDGSLNILEAAVC